MRAAQVLSRAAPAASRGTGRPRRGRHVAGAPCGQASSHHRGFQSDERGYLEKILPTALVAATSLARAADGPGIRASPGDEADLRWMRLALGEAAQAAAEGEVPVGAVVVSAAGELLASGRNAVEAARDSTAHAEMTAIRAAAAAAGGWRLGGATLYVTLEPCPMCAAAAQGARLARLVYGAPSPLLGADGSYVALLRPEEGGTRDPRGGESINAGGGREGGGAGDAAPAPGPAADPAAPPVAPRRPHPFNPDMVVQGGVLAGESSELLRDFYRARRREAVRRGGGLPR